MSEEQWCNRCKVVKPIWYFSLNKADRYLKTCDRCRIVHKAYRDRTKCPHGKSKYHCKDCGGVSVCEHGRQKRTCRECGGNAICEHGRRKNQCIPCGGISICKHEKQRSNCKLCSDPVKITIRNWLTRSKKRDKEHNQYDPVNFIDGCFCKSLVEDYPNCCYCKCKLQIGRAHV